MRAIGDNAVVHALTATGGEIVRRDHPSGWFLCEGDEPRKIFFIQAVSMACAPGAVAYLGRRGGWSFDTAVRRHQRLRAAEGQPSSEQGLTAKAEAG